MLALHSFGAPPVPTLRIPQLTLDAPAVCGASSLLARAVARCGATVALLVDRPGPGGVHVTVQRSNDRFRADIDLQCSDGTLGRRQLPPVAGACAELMRTVALAICIALDPIPPDVEMADNRGAALEGAVGRPRRGGVWVLPSIRTLTERPPTASPDGQSRVSAGVVARLALEIGSMPPASPGGQVGVSVLGADWSAAAGVGVSRGRTGETDGVAADVDLITVDLAGCWRTREFLACGVLRAGAHVVDAPALLSESPATSGYLGLGFEVGAAFVLSNELSLTLGVEVLGVPWRGRFRAESLDGPTALFEPEPYALRLLIGLATAGY